MKIEYFLCRHRHLHYLLLLLPPLLHIHLHYYSRRYHYHHHHHPPPLPNYLFLIQRTQDVAATTTNSLDTSLSAPHLSSTKFSKKNLRILPRFLFYFAIKQRSIVSIIPPSLSISASLPPPQIISSPPKESLKRNNKLIIIPNLSIQRRSRNVCLI